LAIFEGVNQFMRIHRLLLSVVLSNLVLVVFSQEVIDIRKDILRKVKSVDSLIYDNPAKSLEWAIQADSLAQLIGDDSLVAVAKNRLGSVYWSKGDLKPAYIEIEKSIKLAESNEYQLLLAKNLGNLGNIYSASGLKLDAIELYKSELQLLDADLSRFRYFAVYNNIGKAFLDINYPDSAMIYLVKAGQFKDSEWEHLWSIFYFNQAESYYKMGQIGLAASMLRLAESNAVAFNSKRGLIRVFQLKAELFLLENKLDSAVQLAESAAEMAMDSRVNELIYITQRTLANCYARNQLFDRAYTHRNLSDIYQDSLLYITSKNEIELASYVNRKIHLEALTNQNMLTQRISDQQRILIWGLSTVVCLVSIFLIILFQNRRTLNVQKGELEKLSAFKSQLFSIVAHDLRSPVMSVASILDVLENKMATKDDIAPLLPEMKRKMGSLQLLFSELLDWGRLQMNHSDLIISSVDIKDLLDQIRLEFTESLRDKGISIIEKIDVSVIPSNKEMLQIAVRNIISNAIKFSHPNSEIRFASYSFKKHVRIEIQDRGIGLSKAALAKLQAGKAQSRSGTKGEIGTGLGMAICIDFIHRLNGQLIVESKEGEGTQFIIQLPKG